MGDVFVWDENRLGWLGIACFDGFGSRSARILRRAANGNGAIAWSASHKTLLGWNVRQSAVERFVEWRRAIDPRRLAERCDREGIRLVLPTDDEFPRLLRNSSDPPGALFVRGGALPRERPVAVVGTRSITPYGKRCAERIVSDLACAGCEIVSGLALGVDAIAHEATLTVGGTTCAVLPGGCDAGSIYPRSNARLAERIIESGGCVISESPPGALSLKHLFALRNRIIASLSLAVLVIEAAEASGSLITAFCGLEENRDILAVPGPITSPQSAGTNGLIKLGAFPCTGAEDVLEHIRTDRFAIANPEAKSVSVPKKKAARRPLSSDEERIVKFFASEHTPDEASRALNIAAHILAIHLSTLELDGFIERLEGGAFLTIS